MLPCARSERGSIGRSLVGVGVRTDNSLVWLDHRKSFFKLLDTPRVLRL